MFKRLLKGKKEDKLISSDCVMDYVSICQKMWSRLCEISDIKYKSLKSIILFSTEDCFTIKIKYYEGKISEDIQIDYIISEGACCIYGVSAVGDRLRTPREIGRLIKGYVYNTYRKFKSITYPVNRFVVSITSGGESVVESNDAIKGTLVSVRCSLDRMSVKKDFTVVKDRSRTWHDYLE